MNDLECYNKPIFENFYDKIDWEEDETITEISEEINNKYEKIDNIFKYLCEIGVKEMKENDQVKESLDENNFIYGEITFRALSYMINYIKLKLNIKIKEGIFYDLGSGTGRAIIAASLIHQFTKCIGIELLESLYNISNSFYFKIKDLPETDNFMTSDIQFIHHNILQYDYDYENTSIVFCNCKTFGKDLMISISNALEPMPSGVICITVTQTLFSKQWQLISSVKKLMSWGCATIHIQIKI